jgi:DNA-binding winged helix-turn-helix (wHTH) protein
MRVQFGPFTVNSNTRQLLREEEEVHLSPKAFDLLCALIASHPDVVTKDELLSRIWQGAYVIEANLNVLVREVRQALGDNAQEPRFVQTVHGRGFRFRSTITHLDAAGSTDGTTGFWLVVRERTFVLAGGDNVIGRDPACRIWLDEPGVSRRHAMIQIDLATRRAIVKDLESTNGTFVAKSRIELPRSLADGDVLGVGSVELTYREWSNKPTERTVPR